MKIWIQCQLNETMNYKNVKIDKNRKFVRTGTGKLMELAYNFLPTSFYEFMYVIFYYYAVSKIIFLSCEINF